MWIICKLIKSISTYKHRHKFYKEAYNEIRGAALETFEDAGAKIFILTKQNDQLNATINEINGKIKILESELDREIKRSAELSNSVDALTSVNRNLEELINQLKGSSITKGPGYIT